jgi:hypothetical protein
MIRISACSAGRAALVTLLSVAPLAPGAAQSPVISVTPCAAADALFRTTIDDVHGKVRGKYWPRRDTTTVFTDDPITRGLSFAIRYGGQRSDSIPAAQLTLFLRAGQGTDSLTEGAMPSVTATVNDSTRLDLAPAQVGASRGGTVYIPVSAYVSPENLLAIARASTTRITVGPIVVPLTPDDRRNLRALYHVALCGEVPTT